MKKLCAAIIVFVAAIVLAAVWFSPLGFGDGMVYCDNTPRREASGCYAADEAVRVDMSGGESELNAVFCGMIARVVKTEHAGELTIVYALSSRVAADVQYTCDGIAYNVMAAYGGGNIVIGTPIIQGSY